ncbi:hypothetical protein Pan54_22130 [Rubinisphaera italica]|uniref:Uncharacterized protein n=1 Tax=Rubinisphaera italica TaxID=2527969 RepID=A0A5C5XEK4_9PLAN|nr:hypothetical protein Pan54_22130 [Rubinisphaera italica]
MFWQGLPNRHLNVEIEKSELSREASTKTWLCPTIGRVMVSFVV